MEEGRQALQAGEMSKPIWPSFSLFVAHPLFPMCRLHSWWLWECFTCLHCWFEGVLRVSKLQIYCHWTCHLLLVLASPPPSGSNNHKFLLIYDTMCFLNRFHDSPEFFKTQNVCRCMCTRNILLLIILLINQGISHLFYLLDFCKTPKSHGHVACGSAAMRMTI